MSNMSELNFLPMEGSPVMPKSTPEELQQRLSLYRLFIKLYEHHGSLLQQILELENISESSLKVRHSHYIQAVVDGDTVFVMSNLGDGKSESLIQSQHTWTIGRDRNSGIHLKNKYVSRRHAAIRYIEQGFYLIDFNSTNGTFINGEQIYQPTRLEDGDIIQIGNVTCDFFVNQSCRVLPTVAVELLMHLVPKQDGEQTEKSSSYRDKTKTRKLDDSEFIQEESLVNNEVAKMQTFEEQLSQQWKSDILDRFYSKQAMKDSV